MFIKTTRAKGKDYVKIVEGYRENGKSKHRTIVNLGRADRLSDSGVENIVNGLKKFVKNYQEERRDINTLKEKSRANYGYIAYRKIWNKYKLSPLLRAIIRDRKIEYDLLQTVFLLVINQLLSPSSKYFLQRNQDGYLTSAGEVELQHIYRSLDVLAENKINIENALFRQKRDLFNQKIDIVFYDVTTIYFESQLSDELRDFGFSKDGKFNEVQVVLGLLIDGEGRPIGYELYPGNTFDSKTLLKILTKLKKQFRLNKVIIVADKGINSKLNLKQIKDKGFDYIVSSRIKNMNKKITEKILSKEGYKRLRNSDLSYLYEDFEEEDNYFKYKTLAYKNKIRYKIEDNKKDNGDPKWKTEYLEERLVCTYSKKRARKDRRDRERALDKAQKVISDNNKSVIYNKRGYKRFIITGEEKKRKLSQLALDDARIKQESKYDGFYVIQCSDLSLDPLQVIDNYHYLFKIEESFRVLKSTMETRPIFLRTPAHIKGHFVICFIAFLLERELEFYLRRRKIKFSAAKMKRALNSMELSELEIEGDKYYMKSKHELLAGKIFALLRINQPANLMPEEKTRKYIDKFNK